MQLSSVIPVAVPANHSVYRPHSFCCIDGTVPAHKAMLVEMFKLLGVVGLAEADCLIVPEAMVADLEQALAMMRLQMVTEIR